MNSPFPLEESDYHQRVDAVLETVEAALEAAEGLLGREPVVGPST